MDGLRETNNSPMQISTTQIEYSETTTKTSPPSLDRISRYAIQKGDKLLSPFGPEKKRKIEGEKLVEDLEAEQAFVKLKTTYGFTLPYNAYRHISSESPPYQPGEIDEQLAKLSLLATPIWVYDPDRHRQAWANPAALKSIWKATDLAELRSRSFHDNSEATDRYLRTLASW